MAKQKSRVHEREEVHSVRTAAIVFLLVSLIGTFVSFSQGADAALSKAHSDSETCVPPVCLGPLCVKGEGENSCISGALTPSPAWVAQASLRVASTEPRIFVIDDFLSKKEVAILKDEGSSMLSKTHGSDWEENLIYSSEFYKRRQHPFMQVLEERIGNITGLPPDPTDEMELMFSFSRPYKLPQQMRNCHHDKNSAPMRTVTVIIYLTTAKTAMKGGHTIFPALPPDPLSDPKKVDNSPEGGQFRQDMGKTLVDAYRAGHRILEGAQDGDLSNPNEGKMWSPKAFKDLGEECKKARAGKGRSLSFLPKAGQAVVFYSDTEDGGADELAWHLVCHPVRGESRFAVQKFKHAPAGQREAWQM